MDYMDYFKRGYQEGKEAARSADWQPGEMQNAYDDDTIGEIAGDILSNYQQYAGTIYYEDEEEANLLDFEEGFFDGFEDEVEKMLKKET